jgi:hypothetical protein
MNKGNAIRKALLKYPNATVKELAQRCKTSVQYIYDTRYQMKKKNKASGYPPLETPEEAQAWEDVTKESLVRVNAIFNKEYEAPEVKEEVNHPPHYTVGGVETIDFIEAKQLNFNLGNVVKYLSRAGEKDSDPLQDLQKARWYLNREIARVE